MDITTGAMNIAMRSSSSRRGHVMVIIVPQVLGTWHRSSRSRDLVTEQALLVAKVARTGTYKRVGALRSVLVAAMFGEPRAGANKCKFIVGGRV